jgi:hypothetical protein
LNKWRAPTCRRYDQKRKCGCSSREEKGNLLLEGVEVWCGTERDGRNFIEHE